MYYHHHTVIRNIHIFFLTYNQTQLPDNSNKIQMIERKI